MLLHEINSMLNEDNVSKLASVSFSTGGDHGKGRFRHMLTVALRTTRKSFARVVSPGESKGKCIIPLPHLYWKRPPIMDHGRLTAIPYSSSSHPKTRNKTRLCCRRLPAKRLAGIVESVDSRRRTAPTRNQPLANLRSWN
jgi:hypothetical protein